MTTVFEPVGWGKRMPSEMMGGESVWWFTRSEHTSPSEMPRLGWSAVYVRRVIAAEEGEPPECEHCHGTGLEPCPNCESALDPYGNCTNRSCLQYPGRE